MKKSAYIILFTFLACWSFGQIKLEKYTFGNGLTFKGESGYKITLNGYVQPSFEMKQAQDGDETFNRFRMRRARLRLSGSSKDSKFSYRLQLDLSGSNEGDSDENSNNILLDAFVNYKVTNNVSLSFGQKSTPTDNLELGLNSQTLQLPERSRVTSAFSSIREFGLFADGSFKINGTDMVIRPSVAITNGDGMNVFGKDYGGFKYGGRINFLPFGTFRSGGQFREVDMSRELTPKLLLGFVYSYNNGISDRRGRTSGDILYLNDQDEVVLPDYEKIGAQFLFKYKGFSMLGEFVKANAYVKDEITQRVRNDGTSTTNFEIDGEQNVNNYIKNRLMLGKGFNIQAGYLFQNLWSVDARYTNMSADRYSFLNNGAFYDRPNYYEIGVSKYLSRSYAAKIQASVTYVDADDDARDNNNNFVGGHEWIGRLILTVGF